MRQSSLVARTIESPSRRDCSVTPNPWTVRNRMTFPCISCDAGGFAISFQLKVSGMSRTSNQLNARFALTSKPPPAKSQGPPDNQEIGNRMAPLAMDYAVVPLTKPHQANPRDVHRNHRQGGNKAAKKVPNGPRACLPLVDEDPGQECERHVRQRRAIRQDDQAA